MIYAISAVLVFSALILIHEFGHFIVAKKVGMKVNEFSLGMGPKIWSSQKGETLYSLRAFPIGGYIKPEGEDAESDDPRAFNNRPLWARTAVVAAGPIFNFIMAFVIIIGLLTFVGRPAIPIFEVTPGMPVAGTGIQAGDIITKINGKNVFFFSELISAVSGAKGGNVTLTVQRNGKILEYVVPTVYSKELSRYAIGIKSTGGGGIIKSTYVENFKLAPSYSAAIMKELGTGLKRLFTGQMSREEVAGPVRIVKMTGEAAKMGIITLLNFTAFLSLNLGVVNLLPIPALDGGRLLFFAAEAVRGRPIDQKKEAIVHLIGFALLITLIIMISFNEIKGLILGVI